MGISSIKKWNKKGLQFRNAFFAVIIVGMVVTAFGIIISEWNTHYNSGLAYDLGQFDGSSGITRTVDGYEAKLTPTSPDQGNDYQSNTLQAAYGIITNIIAPFKPVFGQNGMLDAVTDMFGLPDFVRITIVTLMILAIIFALLALIFRANRTTT